MPTTSPCSAAHWPRRLEQRARRGEPVGEAAGREPAPRAAPRLASVKGSRPRSCGLLLAATKAHQVCQSRMPRSRRRASSSRIEAAVEGARALEPVQHLVAGGIVGAGAQGAHQGGGRARGRQLPAGFVVRRHALRGQLRADPARQRAVGGHQRHRRTALGQMAQHAGRGALGLVFGIDRRMQGRGAGGRIQRGQRKAQQRARRTGPPACWRAGRFAGRRARSADRPGPAPRRPAARRSRSRSWRPRRARCRSARSRCRTIPSPCLHRRRRARGRPRPRVRPACSAAASGASCMRDLDQPARQRDARGREAGARQQRLRGEQVARHVEGDVVRRRARSRRRCAPSCAWSRSAARSPACRAPAHMARATCINCA